MGKEYVSEHARSIEYASSAVPAGAPREPACAAAGDAPANVASRRSTAFFVCTAVLVISALSLSIAKSRGWLQLIKSAVPLRKPLDALTLPASASHYRLVRNPPLSSDFERELGTQEYVGWSVENRRTPGELPAHLFITYYTGKPDQVPHVMEECAQVGANMQLLEAASIPLDVPQAGAGERGRVRLRSLLFRNPRDTMGQRVFYTFSCNGSYYDNRDAVRLRMMSFNEKYLYYSKIDLSFRVDTQREPREQIEQRAKELFAAIIPVLAQEHWPDWDAVIRRQAEESGQ